MLAEQQQPPPAIPSLQLLGRLGFDAVAGAGCFFLSSLPTIFTFPWGMEWFLQTPGLDETAVENWVWVSGFVGLLFALVCSAQLAKSFLKGEQRQPMAFALGSALGLLYVPTLLFFLDLQVGGNGLAMVGALMGATYGARRAKEGPSYLEEAWWYLEERWGERRAYQLGALSYLLGASFAIWCAVGFPTQPASWALALDGILPPSLNRSLMRQAIASDSYPDGFMYFGIYGKVLDPTEAEDRAAMAQASGRLAAQERWEEVQNIWNSFLRTAPPKEAGASVAALRLGARKGHRSCLVVLGQAYAEGECVRKDPRLAFLCTSLAKRDPSRSKQGRPAVLEPPSKKKSRWEKYLDLKLEKLALEIPPAERRRLEQQARSLPLPYPV